MAIIYLGLGSNLGDRRENIQRALGLLEENNVSVEKISTIIETKPVGGVLQGDFLNAVLKGQTDLSPRDLLALTQAIENKVGREKTVPNGPRTIDIDILLYADQEINTPELTIPHPRMLERDFVMIPLKEIEPLVVMELAA